MIIYASLTGLLGSTQEDVSVVHSHATPVKLELH